MKRNLSACFFHRLVEFLHVYSFEFDFTSCIQINPSACLTLGALMRFAMGVYPGQPSLRRPREKFIHTLYLSILLLHCSFHHYYYCCSASLSLKADARRFLPLKRSFSMPLSPVCFTRGTNSWVSVNKSNEYSLRLDVLQGYILQLNVSCKFNLLKAVDACFRSTHLLELHASDTKRAALKRHPSLHGADRSLNDVSSWPLGQQAFHF